MGNPAVKTFEDLREAPTKRKMKKLVGAKVRMSNFNAESGTWDATVSSVIRSSHWNEMGRSDSWQLYVSSEGKTLTNGAFGLERVVEIVKLA